MPSFEEIAFWWFEGLISKSELTTYGYKEVRSGQMVWLENI